MSNDKKIVITGMGPIASTGIGSDAFWKGILDKRIGLELVKAYVGEDLWESFYLHK